MNKLFTLSVLSTAMIFGISGCDLFKKKKSKSTVTTSVVEKNLVLGPVSNSEVSLFTARDEIKVDSVQLVKTNDKGQFDFADLNNIQPKDYYLIKASKGNLLDANGDGVQDVSATTLNGDLYAVVSGAQIKNSGLKVSLISDIAWQYIKHNIKDLSNEDIQKRLSDIANILFLKDITADNVVDDKDLVAFDPRNKAHLDALAFEYQFLFQKNEDGVAIIDEYLAGNTQGIDNLLDKAFGTEMSQKEGKDFRSKQVKIEVLPFGKGSFSTVDKKIQYTSDGQIKNLYHFYEKNGEMITITATPDADTEILNWSGCDVVSDDKTQCQVKADTDKQIIPSFGYKEAKIVENLVDLSTTATSLEGDSTIYVTVNHADDEMVAKMQKLKPNDYVVGSAEYGFLRKIVSVTQVSEYKYNLETVEASLDEVVMQGTGVLSAKVQAKDLVNSVESAEIKKQNLINESYDLNSLKKSMYYPKSTLAKPVTQPQFYSNIEGVTLVKPQSPNDTKFTIKLGGNQNDLVNKSLSGKVGAEIDLGEKLGKGKLDIKVSGEIQVEISQDIGLSYGFGGLESVKLATDVTTSEKIVFTAGREFGTKELCQRYNKGEDCLKVHIGTIPIQQSLFMIGWLPVYVNSKVDIYLGIDGKVSAKVEALGVENKTQIKGGILYDHQIGLKPIAQLTNDWNFIKPEKVEFAGEARVFINAEPTLLVYNTTGVAVPLTAYAKGEAKTAVKIADDKNPDYISGMWKRIASREICEGGIDLTASVGYDAKAKIVLGNQENSNKLAKALNKLLNLGDMELTLIEVNKILYKKNFGGICSAVKKPAKMAVTGGNIVETIKANDTTELRKTYTITNEGEETLNWKLEYQNDGITVVSKTSGELAGGETETVEVVIDKSKLSIGNYRNQLKFINTARVQKDGLWAYVGNVYADYITGNTPKNIYIKTIPEVVASPNNVKVSLLKPTIAQLVWDYPSHDKYAKLIKGYHISMREVGQEWEIYHTINDASQKSIFIPNLLTGKDYEFAVTAFINDASSEPSQVVTLNVPLIKPEGNCQAYFTGLVVADKYESVGISEAYKLDGYSEYVGAGLYPDNTQAFPKSVDSTFDGIAIAKGTKVTIYSDKNFKGTILYEKVGPAIINNKLWQYDSRYYPAVNRTWKEPLQTEFPFSVREWSQSNMHDWSFGSLKVECGYK